MHQFITCKKPDLLSMWLLWGLVLNLNSSSLKIFMMIVMKYSTDGNIKMIDFIGLAGSKICFIAFFMTVQD